MPELVIATYSELRANDSSPGGSTRTCDSRRAPPVGSPQSEGAGPGHVGPDVAARVHQVAAAAEVLPAGAVDVLQHGHWVAQVSVGGRVGAVAHVDRHRGARCHEPARRDAAAAVVADPQGPAVEVHRLDPVVADAHELLVAALCLAQSLGRVGVPLDVHAQCVVRTGPGTAAVLVEPADPRRSGPVGGDVVRSAVGDLALARHPDAQAPLQHPGGGVHGLAGDRHQHPALRTATKPALPGVRPQHHPLLPHQ